MSPIFTLRVRRLGGLAAFVALALAASPAAAATATPRPLEYDREIVAADLAGRPLRELALMRNTIFARAGQPFRRPWINAYFRKQPWYKPVDIKKQRLALTPLGTRNARFIGEYESRIPRAELKARKAKLDAGDLGGLSPDEAAIERTLLANALGQAVQEETRAAVGDVSGNPLDDPSLLDNLLTTTQLEGLSRRDLRILRNMIYARRGRKFRSPLLQDYFSRMEWYAIDPAYSDKNLTRNDQRNISLIRGVEDSLGGPMDDDQQKAEDFLGAA